MGKLTALQVKNAKPGRHSDGDCLYLVVDDKLNRKWVLRIQVNGQMVDLKLLEEELALRRWEALQRRATHAWETPIEAPGPETREFDFALTGRL